MKKIFKQSLGHTKGTVELEIPKNSAILAVKEQRGEVVVYYLCDPDEKETYHFKFHLFETGEDLSESIDSLSYLKTVFLFGGEYVLHVFVDLCALEERLKTQESETV